MARKETEKKRATEKRGTAPGRSGRAGTERTQTRETRGRQEQEEQRTRGAETGEWRTGEASLESGSKRGAWRGDEGGRRASERGLRGGEGGSQQRGALMRQRAPFQEIERAFGVPFGRLFGHPFLSGGLRGLEEMWPSTDVYREGNDLVVKADLPGMKKDDVEVSIENGELVVSGERRQESKVDEKNVYRSECSYGSFYRRVPLPDGADPEHVEAKFKDGVLEVHVPLREEKVQRARRVEIR